MKKKTFKSLVLLGLMGTIGGVVLTSCGSGVSTEEEEVGCLTASCYLGKISDVQWAAAEQDALVMEMEKTAASDPAGAKAHYEFRWKDKDGNQVHEGYDQGPTFEAGKPYVIHFKIPVTTAPDTFNNSQDHYFSAWTNDGVLPNFYQAVAVHKIETAEMIYKTPYILDFELNKPNNNKAVADTPRQTEAKIFFVPVRNGDYTLVCKPGFHAIVDQGSENYSGMVTQIFIRNGISSYPNFQLDSNFNTSVWVDDSRRTTSNTLPWTQATLQNAYLTEAAGEVTIAPAAGESLNFGSDLKTNTTDGLAKAYQFRFQKAAGSEGNYVVSGNFFRNVIVRKIHDRHVQLKPIYTESMEFKAGASANNLDAAGSEDYAQPGAFEADLFFVADAQYSVTDGTAEGGGTAKTYPISVSIGSGASTTTNFTVNPWVSE